MRRALTWILVGSLMTGGWRAALDWWTFAQDRDALYGQVPDDSRPWDGTSCLQLATTAEVLQIMKLAGAKKSLSMKWVRENADGAEIDEIVGEMSRAWDRGTEGRQFYAQCVARLRSWKQERHTEPQKPDGDPA